MRIAAVASAFPAYYYPHEAIISALQGYWGGRLEKPELLSHLHRRVGVHYRHLAFPLEDYKRFHNWGEANATWMQVAEELGEASLDSALGRAGLTRQDVNALFVLSITGIASPSLDARLINRMRLRPDLKRTPIFGLGCVGGAVGLTRAADYVLAYPLQVAALLCVEVCSLTLQRDDLSTANLIATGLFADGAAAVILTGSDRAYRGPRILGSRSVFYPDSEGVMGWRISERGLHIVLSPKLPELISTHLAADVDNFLGDHGLARCDVDTWLVHPGGPRVLKAVEGALALAAQELKVSWECLRTCGNLSSVSVLLVLEEVMMHQRPGPGELSMLLALGPGFCAEMLLIQW
jgi:alkylresorcinol/alkylpyrone synthase